MFSLNESTSNKERFLPCSITSGTNKEITPTIIPINIIIDSMDAVVFLNLNFSVKNLTKGRPIRETTAAIIMYEIKI